MATLNGYKVHFHFEVGGKKSGPDYIQWVSAAANDYNTIKTALSNNSALVGSGTLVIDAVQNPPSSPGSLSN